MSLSAYRNRMIRQNKFLFNWSADDGEVTFARSGQIGTFTRASGSTVVTSNGSVNVGYGQPRWEDTPKGASLLLLPSDETLSFPCEWMLGPLSLYVDGYIRQPTDATTASPTIVRLGDGSASTIDLISKIASGDAEALYTDGSGNPSAVLSSGNPVLNDYVEFLLLLDSARKVTMIRSVNSGADQVSSLSAAGVAFSGGFHGTILKFADAANAAKFSYRHVRVSSGSAETLTSCRAESI